MNRGRLAAMRNLKVLILKPSSLGDVIHALPVLRVLKGHYPQAEVHWWVEDSLAPLLENDQDLTTLQIFNRRNWCSPIGVFRELRSALKLRRERYDWVIDLQGLARSAWFGWLVRGKVTVGVDSGREGARAFYDVAVSRATPETHAVDWYLDVARAMGVDVSGDYEWLAKQPCTDSRLPDPKAKLVVFCPGARWPNKRWPMEHFARLAAELQLRENHLRIAILGSSEDAGLSRAISNAAPNTCLDLAGKTALLDMVEWLRHARVVVANDSGPLHIAVALDRPLVALYGPTHVNRTGPYCRSDDAMRVSLHCAPCQVSYCKNPIDRECLRAISPGVVADAVQAYL